MREFPWHLSRCTPTADLILLRVKLFQLSQRALVKPYVPIVYMIHTANSKKTKHAHTPCPCLAQTLTSSEEKA